MSSSSSAASSDDEDAREMRLMRAAAAHKARRHETVSTSATSSARLSLEDLRQKQLRVQEAVLRDRSYFEEGNAIYHPQKEQQNGAAVVTQTLEDGWDADEEGNGEADVADEADVHEGIRAQFPLSFGKQEQKQTPLEIVHMKTKRADEDFDGENVAVQETLKQRSKINKKTVRFLVQGEEDAEGLRRADEVLVKEGVDGRRRNVKKDDCIGLPLPTTLDGTNKDEMIGLPLPLADDNNENETPLDDANDNGMIGPPRPPQDALYDNKIGPPRPPEGYSSIVDGSNGDEMIGPPLPPDFTKESSSSGEGEGEDEDPYLVPVSNEIILRGSTKVVSALAVDPSGSRVLTGSYDYCVRMYDFQGMDSRLRSFRQIEPSEGHQVRSLSWSPTADRFLAVTGSAQAKIYDRDGVTLGEFVKGDMYIRDLKNTKGHISGLTCGEWHPIERQTILSSSEDGSLRIWDVTDFKTQKQVIKPKLARPGRVAVTTCTWGMAGKCISGGLQDGSIQIWNVKSGWGSRPDIYVPNAHEGGDDVTSLQFSADSNILLSRSTDGTLKIWDLRKMPRPLKVFSGLPNSYAQTSATFSPDERLILTGTSTEKGGKVGGLLLFYDKVRLELVRKIGVHPLHSVVCCAWHPRLNQIFATVGDKKEGGTHILYDPALSERGALVCVARAPRKKSVEDFEAKPVVRNPHALPLFRDEPSRKRQREKARSDPLMSKRPDLPVTGPGFGGRVGVTKGSLLTQYLLKEGGLMKETWMDEDPREAILKYADAAAKDPKYIGPAYAETQPEPIFQASDSEEEET
ncbi:hypothetical protein O6H91_14G029800 [Diphasiastrum complanatum]|uniref:Uncharacterized protein n=1 Tax=Diphasiastrum complanatum TaxID=34168 RepID=A0ACC2BMR0_DIPCM|nr:hypothetical protein O6H91_14G029800 [Diphasiastrum complanatum]